jgi:hypothetical protein
MEKFQAVVKFLRGLWRSGSGLSPELERYCRDEGVDPWTLAQALRDSEPRGRARARNQEEVPVATRGPMRAPLAAGRIR